MRKQSMKKSSVWTHFKQITPGAALCKICKARISSKGSTSNLSRHLRAKHPTVLRQTQARQEPVEEGAMSSTARGAGLTHVVSRPIDPLEQRRLDDALATFVAARFEPFSFVEGRGFRDFTKLMNPNYTLPSKKTLSSEIFPDLYRRTREKVKESVDKAEAVCLTLSRTTALYMSVTCHFIDEDFQMVSCLLDCFVMSEEYIHDELAEQLLRVAEDWNLAAKVVSCVSDDADDIVKAIGMTGWPHLPCFAHTLNLIANNGIAAVQPTVDMVKAIVEYVHDNTVAAGKLKATQEQLNVPEPRLKQDCPTGWNPVYSILSWVLENREAVICTLDFVDHGLPTPSAEEWEDVQLACDILKHFDQVRVQMSEQRYDSASNMYIVRGSLQKLTANKQRAGNLRDPVKKMVDTMVQEMATRFHNMEHNHLLREAAALDPRFNKFFQHQDEEADRTYRHLSRAAAEVPRLHHQHAREEEGEARDENPTLRTQNPTTDAMSEVSVFVEEETYLDIQSDPLVWWKARCRAYPRLCTLMKKRLCIVATSVPLESLFGNSEEEEILEISERLDQMNPTKVSQLVFLHAHTQ